MNMNSRFSNQKRTLQNNFVEIEPKNFDYIKSMYPSMMLDENRKIGALGQISPTQERSVPNSSQSSNNMQNFECAQCNKRDDEPNNTNTTSQSNDMSNFLNNLTQSSGQNSPLSNLLPLLLSGNLGGGNPDIMNIVTKLPQFQGQNGANLINMLSNISNKTNEKPSKNFEEYKVIKELD